MLTSTKKLQRTAAVYMAAILLSSCGNEAEPAKQEIDTFLKKVDTTADRGWDSLKAGAKEVRDELKDVIDRERDTAHARKPVQ